LKCGEKSVARCAQIEFSTKCRRYCSEEKIKKGNLRRENDKNIQGKEPLNFLSKPVDKIFPQREANDPIPSDLVNLHRAKP
jgi:hypothetical protein